MTTNTTKPITGVCNANIPEWINDDIVDSVDAHYEQYLKDNPEDEYGDGYIMDSSKYLIGFIRTDDGNCNIDPSAEYSAIVQSKYIKVIKSKYTSECGMCSLCFPNQGDIETEGHNTTYTLPPDIWGDANHLPISEMEA